MRKLALAAVMAVAVIAAGLFAWQAEATTTTAGTANLGATAKNYSPVKEIACRGWGRHCPPGFIWTCGPVRCWCRPC